MAETAKQVATLSDETEISRRVTRLLSEAKDLQVSTDDEAKFATSLIIRARNGEELISDFFAEMEEATKAAHDSVVNKKKSYLAPLKALKSAIQSKLDAFVDLQDRKRQAEQERLQKIEDDKKAKRVEQLNKRLAVAKKDRDKAKVEAIQNKIEDEQFALPVVVAKKETIRDGSASLQGRGVTTVEVTDTVAFVKALLVANPTALSGLIKWKDAQLVAWVKNNSVKTFDGLKISEMKKATVVNR